MLDFNLKMHNPSAEELAARWMNSQQEVETGNRYDKNDVECWFYKLDNINPGYVEPLPEELRRVSDLTYG